MWEVWYGHEAKNYLSDNGQLVADLFFAMESLAESAGWPQRGDYYLQDALVIWEILHHLIIYERFADQQVVQIASIKPDQ